MRLAPSILSFDLTTLRESVPRLQSAGADVLHLDVMDGGFVPPITFGDALVAALRPHATLPFEAHLMTLNPERQFEAFARAGCGRITFHAEATVHAHRHAQALRSMGLQAGVAINPATPVEAILPIVDEIDLALVMTVNPGYGGQAFLPFVLDKVRRLRAARPDLTIQVDGGIAPETIRAARDAGADLFVVGSYLAKAEDLSAAVAGVGGGMVRRVTAALMAVAMALTVWIGLMLPQRPGRTDPRPVRRAYASHLLLAIGGIVVCLVGAGVGASVVSRQAKREYREEAMRNLRSLVEGDEEG